MNNNDNEDDVEEKENLGLIGSKDGGKTQVSGHELLLY
jgi:hypothetical protein